MSDLMLTSAYFALPAPETQDRSASDGRFAVAISALVLGNAHVLLASSDQLVDAARRDAHASSLLMLETVDLLVSELTGGLLLRVAGDVPEGRSVEFDAVVGLGFQDRQDGRRRSMIWPETVRLSSGRGSAYDSCLTVARLRDALSLD